MEALYELVDLVQESADELDGAKASFTRRMQLADPAVEDPESLGSAIADALEKAFDELKSSEARRDNTGAANADADVDGEMPLPSEGLRLDLSEVVDKYGIVTTNTGLSIFLRARRRRSTMAFNSLLVAAVGEFEALVSKCIQSYISQYPGKLNGSDRSFTFAEVTAFEDLEAFRSRAADLYAENVMRGSVDDWMKWFTTNLKVNSDEIAEDWDGLVEVFQRRHLLVHNGGVVNHIYRSKVKKLPGDIDEQSVTGIATRVDVSRQYLQDAIAQLSATGLLLATRTTLKLAAPDTAVRHPVAGLIADASYEFLRDDRGRELTIFSERVLPHCPEESIRLLVQVNLWTHRKKLGGVDAVAGEVRKWDVRHCSQRFKIAKLALLDQHQEVWDMAQRLIKADELSEFEWATWPLFADTRSWLESRSDTVQTVAAPIGAIEGDGSHGSSVEN